MSVDAQESLAGRRRDESQRKARNRFQEPFSRGLVGPLGLGLWGQTGESGRLLLQRPSPDTLRHRSHPDPERQQGREARPVRVARDQQRRTRPAAREAGAERFAAVLRALAHDRLCSRPPRWRRVGDTHLPTPPLGEGSAGAFLAGDAGEGRADWLEHALLATHRASPPAHVWRCLLDLLCPGHAAPPVHPMRCAHEGHRRPKRRFVGEGPLPPPSGGWQGCRCRAQTFCQPRGLLRGMPRGAPP
jgi:hypothetical protein